MFLELEEERHSLRRDVLRAVYQLRILEKEREVGEAMKGLRDYQPFLVPGRFGEGNFDKRFEKYEKDIQEYEKTVEEITLLALHRFGR